MKNKEQILKEFDEKIGKYDIYNGFVVYVDVIKDFISKAIDKTIEETIREVEEMLPEEQDDDIEYNSLYMDGFNSGYKLYSKKVLKILNKLKK